MLGCTLQLHVMFQAMLCLPGPKVPNLRPCAQVIQELPRATEVFFPPLTVATTTAALANASGTVADTAARVLHLPHHQLLIPSGFLPFAVAADNSTLSNLWQVRV